MVRPEFPLVARWMRSPFAWRTFFVGARDDAARRLIHCHRARVDICVRYAE